jgi:hypothetical protein
MPLLSLVPFEQRRETTLVQPLRLDLATRASMLSGE